ncbi:hypothetical protein Tco_1468065 [Tanacetum coccineum]
MLGWIACRRVLRLDGCFLLDSTTLANDKLLVAMGRDGNNQISGKDTNKLPSSPSREKQTGKTQKCREHAHRGALVLYKPKRGLRDEAEAPTEKSSAN